MTDGELNQLGDGIDLVISAPEQALLEMDPIVVKMHRESGLDKAVLASTLSLADAESQVLDFVRQYVPEPRKAPLCGNSIGTDRGFHRPLHAGCWTHTCTTGWSTSRRLRSWPGAGIHGPTTPPRPSAEAIARSPTSWKAWKSFGTTGKPSSCPKPGPSSDEARAIAAKISGQESPPAPERHFVRLDSVRPVGSRRLDTRWV